MQWRWAARLGGVAMVLGVALGSLPDASFATLVPGGQADPVDEDRARLTDLREQLDRRISLARKLDAEVDAAAEAVVDLREERDRWAAALARAQDEVLRLEIELDRIIPRVVAERASSDHRREASAKALATLAGISRRAEIAPDVRARLLAVSPVMFERLRGEPDKLGTLESRGARLAERHRTLQGEVPDLLAGQVQAEMDRSRAARRHEVLAQRHRDLMREVARLTAVEAALARRVLAEERVRSARVEGAPGARRAIAAAVPQSTVGKRRFAREDRPQVVAMAGLSLEAAADEAWRLIERIEAEPFAPPPAKPRGPLLETDRARIVAASDQANVEMARMTRTATVEPAVRLQPPARPITPSPAALLDPVLQTVEARPVITIPARLGQAVAAPDDGRAAFAGRFGSYGLLLILEHERGYHTILWGFSSLRIDTGDPVKAGQIIGEMGEDGNDLELHVEFRRNGRPVGALPWLAASSNKVRG